MPKSFLEEWAMRLRRSTADRVAAWVIVAGMLLLGPCCLRADGEMIEDGEYVIYIFRANGTFTPPTGVSHVEVLVVAGGGGGGGSNASNVGSGGGGGGGVLYETAYAVAGPVMVTMGNGGGGGVGTSRGTQGGNSVFGALTAIGGGGGGAPGGQVDGGSGGSGGGGGGANPASTGGAGGQGNAGGRGRRQGNGQGYGGGGGGRNAAGGDGFGMAGNGGGGSTYLNFAAFGDGGFFAGGGGGGRGGLGGIGGGGAGGPYNGSAGSPGDANTGGGGGGSAGNPGAAGGSGIVLVRYMATTSVWLTGDVMLNFGDNMAQPGDWQDDVIDATSKINWTSIVNPGIYHKITVRLSDGTLPAGLQLKVYCTRAAGELVLNNTVQNFITGIGNEATTLPLRYTLVVTDVAALFAQVTPLIIEYTIESQ